MPPYLIRSLIIASAGVLFAETQRAKSRPQDRFMDVVMAEERVQMVDQRPVEEPVCIEQVPIEEPKQPPALDEPLTVDREETVRPSEPILTPVEPQKALYDSGLVLDANFRFKRRIGRGEW